MAATPDEKVKPKRSRFGRLVRGLVRLVGALLVLVILGVAFLHTRWGKEWVRARVEVALGDKLDGTLTIGTLDYGFLFDGIDFGGIAIRDRGGKEAVSVRAIHVDLDRGSLLGRAPVITTLDVTGLVLTATQTADGRTNLATLAKPSSGGAPPTSIRIAALSVHGDASLTQLDGTVLALHDLAVTGSVTARPAAQELDAVLGGLTANVSVVRPGAPTTTGDLAIGSATLGRKPDGLDLVVEKLVLGALSVEAVRGRIAIVEGRFAGAQSVALIGGHVDHTKLASELGRELLVDDADLDATLSGPAKLLAVHGAVSTRHTRLTLDGTGDLSSPARPRYQIALVGTGASADVMPAGAAPAVPPIETSVRVTIDGAGVTRADLEAAIALEVGPTRVGAVTIEAVTAKLRANRGALAIDELAAHGRGFGLGATGEVTPDTTLHARVTVAVRPADLLPMLAAAGVALPKKLPPLAPFTVEVTAAGRIDGALDVTLEPLQLAVAGGGVTIAGRARVADKLVGDVSGTVALRGLGLRALAALAGKPPPPVDGTLSGHIGVARTGAARRATYDLTIALREPALAITAAGRTDGSTVTTRATIVRRADHAVLATVTGQVPIDDRGLVPTRRWHVAAEVAPRPVAELLALLPPALRATLPPLALPPGEVALRAELAGTPAQPRGTVDARATAAAPELGPVQVEVHADLAPAAHGGVTVATTATIAADAVPGPLATVRGQLALPALFDGRVFATARVRAGLVVDEAIDIPERTFAGIPRVPPALVALGGVIGGHVRVRGTPPALALDAQLGWHGYQTASGAEGTTTLALTGTPALLTATITHGRALIVTADIGHEGDRFTITARTAATAAPLLSLLPALPVFAGDALRGAELGRLTTDLGGAVVLVRGADGAVVVEQATLTGALALTGGAFALPHTDRRWHDIGLALAGEPRGLRLATLDAHEGDAQVADRTLHASGLVVLEQGRPQRASLVLATHDWLALGSRSPLVSDAPTAAVDLDAHVDADLSTPVFGVDVTVDHLDLRNPDRHDRAHQPEVSSIAGDIIFVDANQASGRLPVPAPPPAASPTATGPAIDARIHIPAPIHAIRAPLDITATGELTVTVRGGAVATRGDVTLLSGTLTTFGQPHTLVGGHVRFTAEHPHGELDLTFARPLPDWSTRELSRAERGQRIHVTGEPAKPTVALSGVANSTLPEVFSTYYAGRPQFLAPPGLPASATVEVPRGDQLNILAYLSLVLPQLLVLDRVSAWADPTEARGAYGRIRNVEAERYTATEDARVRAVARPTTPGRSTAELQWDRVLVHDAHTVFGAGLRAGDRLGGGVGLFFEWSSEQ